MGEMLNNLEHRILEYLSHLWPYISGFFLIVIAGIKLWHHDRKAVKKRIVVLEQLAEKGATHDDLRECRAGVDKQDADNLISVLGEIKDLREDIKQDKKDNHQAHERIMDKMLELHSK